MNKSLFLFLCFLFIGFTSCDAPENPAVNENADTTVAASESLIEKLAAEQLNAYNRADLDAFCACYHDDVQVFDGEEEKPRGIEAFRKRYEAKFATGGFGATVPKRIALGDHCIDLEHWWTENGKRGEVLVRYSLKDDRIGTVQFLR